jgi:hypothetical protein
MRHTVISNFLVAAFKKVNKFARRWWLMPLILAIQEAEIRRTADRSQPRQIVWDILSQKNPTQKKAGGVAQGISPV